MESRNAGRGTVPGGASLPRWAWQARAGQSASLHLANHPEGVVATTTEQDLATGRVGLVDGRTGKIRWRWPGPHPVASAACVDPGGAVYVQTTAGLAIRLDDGVPTWMIESADPAREAGSPVLTGDGGVLIVDGGSVRCLRCGDGRVRWSRPAGAAPGHPGGRMCEGLAVLPLAPGLMVLDPADGRLVWGDLPGTPGPVRAPVGLGDGTVVVVREGGLVQRLDLTTGRIRWSAKLPETAPAADPVLIDELLLVVGSDAGIHLLDSRTGWVLRMHRPYPAAPGPEGRSVEGAVAAVAGHLHMMTVSGEWWRLDPYHWEPELLATLPVAVTSPPVQCGDNLVIPGREGVLLAAGLTDAGTPNSRVHVPAGTPAAAGARGAAGKADRWFRSVRLSRPGA